MKKLIKLFVLLLFLCGSFCLTTISYAQENSEGEEPITMGIQPGTSITLLPGQQFNVAIKTLANNGEAVSYGTVDNNIQNFQRAEEIPAGANTGIISEDGSYPVYAWFDGGTLYYASQSETIYLNENSQQMFFNFNGIEELDLSDFDTSNVTNMGDIFKYCNNLTDLNLSGWNFSKYHAPLQTNMGLRPGIKKINMKNTIFSGDISEFFFGLAGLEELKLDGVDTSNVTIMTRLFANTNLTGLDLSSFDTSSVTNMFQMFHQCGNLEELNLSGWDFSKIGSSAIGSTLYARGSDAPIRKLNLTNAKFGTSLSWAFAYSSYLEELLLSGVDTSNVTNMERTFYGCSKLTGLDLGSFNTSNVTTMKEMFYNCSNLLELDLSIFDTSKVNDMGYMFQGCSNLEVLNLKSFNTSNVTTMGSMFKGCSNLTGLDLSNFDISKVTYMGEYFQGCNNLVSINMDGWNFRSYLIPAGIFGGTPALRNISMSGWKIPETFRDGISRYWGGGGSPIEEIDVSNWDLSNTSDINGLFADSRSLKTIKGLNTWDTSNINHRIAQLFYGCTSLTELDLSSFDTSKVIDFQYIFANTPNLKTIYTSNKFIIAEGTNVQGMFDGTVSVVGGNGTEFDANYIDKTYAKIDKVGQTGYFTDKNAITVKFISSIDKSEITATFAKGQKLTPPTVNGYHVVGGYTDEAMTQKINLNNGVDSYSIIYVKYERNGSSGGGGGGGGGGSSKPDTPKQDEQKPTETPQDDSIVSSGTNVRPAELGENPESETPMDSSEQTPQNDAQEINNSPANNASEGQNQQKYSTEFQQAYEFAKGNGITTMSTIQKADMNGKLTRIQMAKMLSQYAINVLGKEPDVSKGVINFNDVTIKMNMDYDNGVTLAYQLGIMGQNMPNNKFRPNDEVSRAEFVTALSRLLYSTLDGKYESTPKYYINHMERLVKEGIITKDDPKMKELRGYVMIMLMRSAE